MTLEDFPPRFCVKVEVDLETGCWNWLGGINRPDGYGRIRNEHGDMELVHRYTFRHARGMKAGKWRVRHSCHNRTCCNPDHLKAGTQKHNMADMKEAGRGYWQTNPEAAKANGHRLRERLLAKRKANDDTVMEAINAKS